MSNLNIVFFGDSITYGQYVDSNERWTTLLEKRLLEQNITNHTFINNSISGETSTQGLLRFTTDILNNNKPMADILFILFGLNDCNFWDTDKGISRVSPMLYKENIKEMIRRGYHFGIKRIILLTNHVTMRNNILAGGISLEDNRIKYNKILREIAEEENILLVDIESEFNKLSPNEITEMNLPDLLHLSIKGHILFADILEPVLKESIEYINKKQELKINTLNKSATDIFWDSRIYNENDIRKVNISDLTQRQIENNFIFKHLLKTDNILEVGCGNGYLTNSLADLVNTVDAFDYAENMIIQAKKIHKKENINFFWDNLLNPSIIEKQYDVIICIRVLINLRNFEEQAKALENMYKMLKPSGRLILIEGFIEGFNEINNIRKSVNMKELKPAAINYYSKLSDFSELFTNKFDIIDKCNTGLFDFLTRITYPLLVGEENATGYSLFHQKIYPLTQVINTDFSNIARLHGNVLQKQ